MIRTTICILLAGTALIGQVMQSASSTQCRPAVRHPVTIVAGVARQGEGLAGLTDEKVALALATAGLAPQLPARDAGRSLQAADRPATE
ncbi:MAG: hypothetical protein ACJ8AI_01170 [Rhodopila sp.]